MFIYNITININNSVHDEWLEWMKTIHIPDVMSTGMFIENRIYKVLADEDTSGTTYSVQYVCKDLSDYEKYCQQFAPDLQEAHAKKYKDKFVAFRTLLEVI
ncbi:MAG: DUF4286 family protein [Bacteroidia bacterium]